MLLKQTCQNLCGHLGHIKQGNGMRGAIVGVADHEGPFTLEKLVAMGLPEQVQIVRAQVGQRVFASAGLQRLDALRPSVAPSQVQRLHAGVQSLSWGWARTPGAGPSAGGPAKH